MSRLLLYFAFFSFFSLQSVRSELEPIVLLPPSFRWGTENEIVVIPLQTSRTINVQLDVEIKTSGQNEKNRIVYRRSILTSKTNRPNVVKFQLDKKDTYSDFYSVTVKVDKHSSYVANVHGNPNIRTIEVQTDKVFYKKGEKVKVRALPITEEGELYKEEVSFSLWNPNNFKLITKNETAEDRYIHLEFTLPENLQYGEWRIVAIPNDYGGRAVENSAMSYVATFEVQDYALPLIQVLLDAKVTRDSDTPLFTVSARYSHGTLLNGTVRIECKSENSTDTHYLTSLTMMNGFVSSQVKVSQCFPDKHTQSATIIAKVRDTSTSATAETRYQLDLRVAGFDLVPLRPAFSDRSMSFFVFVKPTGSPFEDLPDVVHMNVTCLSTREGYTKQSTYQTKIGEIIGISAARNDFYHCSAIVIFAQREISNAMFSRNVTLIVANMSSAESTNFNLISPEEPTKTSYRVGEEFRATVLGVASEYMVVCNKREIAASGQVEHQRIRFEITEKMVSQCVLYVYSFQKTAAYKDGKPYTDMWMFFVENNCPFTATPNASEISPSDKLSININGPERGLALLHVLDSRMFGLLQRSLMYAPSTYWEIDSFGGNKTTSLRMANFFDDANFKDILSGVCKEAGHSYRSYLSTTLTCPFFGRSSSGISNFCQQQLRKACQYVPSEIRNPVFLRQGATHPDANLSPVSPQFSPDLNVRVSSIFNIGYLAASPDRASDRAAENPHRSRTLPVDDVPQAMETNDDPVIGGHSAEQVKVRQDFKEVWLFNDVPLDTSGKGRVQLTAPDSIANWSIASTFWGPGHFGVCRPSPTAVISKKDFYMIVELPKHIYVNETIATEIIVTTEKEFHDDYLDLSVCISGLSYKACIDQGHFGELGKEVYDQVRLTRNTRSGVRKTPIFFTKPGPVELVFSLRRQSNVQVNHCMEGKMEDQVKIVVNVEKRADTELFYKGIIISPDKPLKEQSSVRSIERIDYDQIRNGNQVTTNIHLNLLESVVQDLALEVSKFLSTAPFNVPKAFRDQKQKLGVLPMKNLFLSDVLKELSVKVYKQKAIRLNQKLSIADLEEIEILEGEIGSLVSEISTFSNCTGSGEPCGFAEYGAPNNDVSIPLTAVSTILLCQRGMEPSTVKGPLRLLFDAVKGVLRKDRDVDDLFHDLPTAAQRAAFLKALIYQVFHDCPENFKTDTNLEHSLMELQTELFFMEHNRYDPRVVAGLALMGLEGVHDTARLQLNKSIRSRNQLPFWDFNSTCQSGKCEENLPNDVKQFIKYHDEKRNEVLLNSLGLLTYTVKGILGKTGGNTNLDHLADWIYEQKRSDEAYYGVLDTFFASRSLYEYRKKHSSAAFFGNPQLNIRYMLNDTVLEEELVLDDNPLLIPLPTNVSRISIISNGEGKVKLGVQLVTTKRQRSKRHTSDEFYPVKITCEQEKIEHDYLRQEVCIQVKSRMLKTLQIDHAFYTGFKSEPDKLDLMPESKRNGAEIVGKVEFSESEAHVIITNLSPDVPTCYQIGLRSSISEPNNLASVHIMAKSADRGDVGKLFITHPDVNDLRKRRKRQMPAINDAIDKICFEDCNNLPNTKVEQLLRSDDTIGCNLKVTDDPYWHNTSLTTSSNYIVIPTSYNSGAKNVTLWLRACNYQCQDDSNNVLNYFAKGQWLLLLGNKHGSVVDSQQRRHYVLGNSDYFERGQMTCSNASTLLLWGNKCDFV
ncbi:hypothetical protein QR680_017984 [Steinernema hermaphroditum]|uniref:Alpha-2-macroglobulin domain-containing protein n=1 Tax=Steinernema hermaphroditum TaxID=289476 RepID=A0AA39LQ06_9BILA|nr:hypothetical protein QR680_017984 [Steinernema hermaphroditum]